MQKGRELRRLEAIAGRDSMTEKDRLMLDFADTFEKEFIAQGERRRDINETLDTGLNILKRFSLD